MERTGYRILLCKFVVYDFDGSLATRSMRVTNEEGSNPPAPTNARSAVTTASLEFFEKRRSFFVVVFHLSSTKILFPSILR